MAQFRMEFIELLTGKEDRFGTHDVQLWRVGILDGAERARVHVARYEKDSLLGRHPTKLWQLFMVIEGSGWVSAEDRLQHPITSGQAVVWHPGEEHDSGSETGMSVLILESTEDLRDVTK